MGRSALAALVVLLRAAATLSAATCLVWLLGATGTGVLYDGPGPALAAARSFDREAAAGFPAFPVEVPDSLSFLSYDDRFNSSDGSAPGTFAQYGIEYQVVVYEPTLTQRIVYVGLHCLLSLGVASIWWLLARIVATARDGNPFTDGNVTRLRAVGWLVLVGGAVYGVASWLLDRWLLAASELADETSVWPLSWRDVPWWSVGVGLWVLVLAAVWSRGVAMRHDVEGLV